MHELGIASSILECVQKEAERHPGVHISKAGVKIGELAGVNVDALQFGFDASSKTGEGLDQWMNWLERSREAKKAAK